MRRRGTPSVRHQINFQFADVQEGVRAERMLDEIQDICRDQAFERVGARVRVTRCSILLMALSMLHERKRADSRSVFIPGGSGGAA